MRFPPLVAVLAVSLATLAYCADAPNSLSPASLDSLVQQELKQSHGKQSSDEQFLRRASLDLIGRTPTLDEMQAFAADSGSGKRSRLIDRLLDQPEFGQHWANYWSDTIAYHVPPPELTFLSYKPFKSWLAEKFNANTGWDKITQEILTAQGTVKTEPAATFVGFHRGNTTKLGAETARIFLGLQLHCAQCHNHKTDRWKRIEFHGFAAFFARSDGKLVGLDGSGTVVKARDKGEHNMPDARDPRKKGLEMKPAVLDGEPLEAGLSDLERRTALAKWLASNDNPWFKKAYVNRVWARLMGRGFFDPVDDMADYQKHLLPQTHVSLAEHFAADGFNIKNLFRLIMNSQAYQQEESVMRRADAESARLAKKLRGEQIYESLAVAIGLPNFTPPPMKATGDVRFPPPPKSTCDLVCGSFGFDPSLAPDDVSRTLGQAMFLMNNDQVNAQITADPRSGSILSKLLAEQADDRAAVILLFQRVLARKPSDQEIDIALAHVKEVGQRGPAFEDLMWGLVNSTEFTTRH
jgi:hypothetical protein